MPYFPLYINIEERDVLIVGGGAVALRKAEKLLIFTPHISVVAAHICEELKGMALCSNAFIKTESCAASANPAAISLYERNFRDDDIIGKALCIAATDDRSLNRHISKLCSKAHIPVNVVDDPELCTFFFPALINDGELSIGISTGGKSPVAARELKKCIDSALPSGRGDIISYMGSIRKLVASRIPDMSKRAAVLSAVFELCCKKHAALSEAELEELISESLEG